MAKADKERITDSLKYLRDKGRNDLALLLETTIGNAEMLARELRANRDDKYVEHDQSIAAGVAQGSALALKSQGWGHKLRSDAKTEKRRALRALLLCQGVFLSAMWTKYIQHGKSPAYVSYLDPDWFDVSRAFWIDRPEADILAAIDCYRPLPGRNPEQLAEAFTGKPPSSGNPGITAYLHMTSRDAAKITGPSSCYGSIIYWLFRAGFVGLPHFLRFNGAETESALKKAFGAPGRAWGPDTNAPPADNAVPQVARGTIMHLYCEGDRWKGHWIVCNDRNLRQATGCNNDTEGGRVKNDYSSIVSIPAQFRGYKEPKGQRYEEGIMDLYDPMLVPDR